MLTFTGIATGMALMLSGTNVGHSASTIPTTQDQTANLQQTSSEKTIYIKPIGVIKEKVREYYKEHPILAEISKCESNYRQWDETGKILRGKVNSKDIGVMQINTYYHADKAEKLGYDLETLEGNMAYAKWLYEKEGVQPWSASSPCWGKHISMATK